MPSSGKSSRVARTTGCAWRGAPPPRTWTSSRWKVMSSVPSGTCVPVNSSISRRSRWATGTPRVWMPTSAVRPRSGFLSTISWAMRPTVRRRASPSSKSFAVSACAATSNSFPASRDRVKGARRRLAARPDDVQPGEQAAVQLLGGRARRDAELVAEEAPQAIVDADCLGGVVARRERLHQKAVAALPERRKLDQGTGGALGRRQLRAAHREARRRDAFERTQAHVLEPTPALLDPGRVLPGQEAAVGNVERSPRGRPCARPLAKRDRGLGPVHAGAGCLEVDPRVRREDEPHLALPHQRLGAENTPQLREERRERGLCGARRVGRPERVREFVPSKRSRAVGREVDEEKTALTAGKGALEPLRAHLDDEAPAELNPRSALRRQGFDKVTATAARDNACVECKEAGMAKVVNCECGQTVQAESDAELVAQVETHVQRDHPELVGKLSRDDILGMAEEE